ncbi:oxygen-dependent coproporphyrinogen oxidase [Candidatus Marinamargulisbacteria bacterium SCGC AG-333-B06]|nr:oxygen-dependent coproporphyrinogen oxidase [Candidatus Marinamargulisbacteria bacterium SCGC AG-333-B06]
MVIMSLAKAPSKMGNCMVSFVTDLQTHICDTFLTFENKPSFHRDSWQHPHHCGGGISCIFEDGNIFEKAGVNVSSISGSFHTDDEKAMFSNLLIQQGQDSINLDNATYFATGISLVCHPINPFIPTIHMNYRYFEIQSSSTPLWWFGGGCDLTPYFLDHDLITHFHTCLKSACDSLDLSYYPHFKEACDSYFYLPHRHEHRGIGGIFFDYLNSNTAHHYFSLVQSCGQAFLDSYLPFIETNQKKQFNHDHTQWQRYRRGRYVEFNLLHDRGTKFGLQTKGRIESIFMSLPKHVTWTYNEDYLTDNHHDLIQIIKSPRNWV